RGNVAAYTADMVEFHVKRCFVAIPLDEMVVADLADAMAGLTLEGMRRPPLENLHVTVKFLGDVDDPQMPQILEALATATEDVPPFELELQGLTYLPNPRRPRVLAAKLDRPAPLLKLQQQVEELTHAIGFQKEGRVYNPHITLGRYRKPPRDVVDLQQASEQLKGESGWPVHSMVLLQSVLESAGPRYVELAEFKLFSP
ncbi:MAG: RNA 2',3'-cyclic phosphodiesterase, partial [Phycisphaeraceae bacterium]